jgi:hypothetical protein
MGLWHAVHQPLAALRAQLSRESSAGSQNAPLSASDLYLVVPPTFTVDVLDTWHDVLTAHADHWVLRQHYNAVLCTLAYYLAAPVVQATVVQGPTLCTLFDARSARDIRLLQARCTRSDTHWEVTLRHYAHGELATADFDNVLTMAQDLHDGTPLWLVHAAEASLHGLFSARLRDVPGHICWAMDELSFHPVQEVKARGACALVQGMRGERAGEPTVDVTYPWYVGVESGARRFTVLLGPEHLTGAPSFPLSQTRTLMLHGQLNRSVRFNLWAGFSTRVLDAMPLGFLTLPREHLRGSARVAIRFTCTLDSGTTGTAALTLLSPYSAEPAFSKHMTFRLPLMMC